MVLASSVCMTDQNKRICSFSPPKKEKADNYSILLLGFPKLSTVLSCVCMEASFVQLSIGLKAAQQIN